MCWGRDALNGPKPEGPTPIPNIPSPRALFASGGATCAETSAGLSCWGDNLFGQIHMPPSLEYELPAGPSPEWQNADHGALGPEGACVIGSAVLCWGQIGSSMTPSTRTRFGLVLESEQGKSPITGSRTVLPHAVPGIDRAVQVAFGIEHVCALMRDGTVRCLGENAVGQLGRLTKTFDGHHDAAPVEGLRDVVQIEAGLAATCARTATGEVHCWGSNYHGHLGVENESSLVPNRRFVTIAPEPHDTFWPRPLRVQGLPPVRQLSVGGTHVCAVVEDGRVFCWGANAAGQLGVGNTVRQNTPNPMVGVDGAIDVAASSYGPKSHTCVLLTSGAVRCAGRNGHGELGTTPGKDELTAVPVPGL